MAIRHSIKKLFILSAALSCSVLGQAAEQATEQPLQYSPYVAQKFPRQVFFGDTHFHSSFSVDSGMMGNKVDPNMAFRFARGEEIVTSTGHRAKLIRPLDFLVVSDHAEYLGIADLLNNGNPQLLATDIGKQWYQAMREGGDVAWQAAIRMTDDFMAGTPSFRDAKIERSVWERVVDIASQYNDPGKFTALNGYEWTSSPGGNNLHRVVVFQDGPDKVKQILPFSAFDSSDPEKLWGFLADYEKKTGGRALAIPHNPNISNGLMFAETVKGQSMTKDYAERRARWEPLTEVTQMKGDSEAHPLLSPEDEFANFENWDKANFNGDPKQEWMLQYEYARSALRKGVQLQQKLGVNPFKFGMIGSSDTHTGLSSTREENYFGKLPHLEPSAKRSDGVVVRSIIDNSPVINSWELSASGLVAVWAQENTREGIFSAMAKKEVYGTTGTRMSVRVFAGWDFQPEDAVRPDFAAQGYARGVPMGGDLTSPPSGKAPRFTVQALRDPDGANLDRVQIIKGWVDADGKTQERIYDVAVADGRTIGDDGRCRTSVGDSVDVDNASYTNAIGDPFLSGYWQDPDFDPSEHAFYYVRAIEIPTPRWTTYDAKRFGIQLPKDVPLTVAERAYTSPIWYTP